MRRLRHCIGPQFTGERMRKITITIWDDDITLRAFELDIELTRHQCKEVLRRLEKDHDMNVGICWDTIDATIHAVVNDRRVKDLSTPVPSVRKHRNTDPATSVESSRVSRVTIRERILTALGQAACIGLSSKEVAERINIPLNSVTPRFAELDRQGLIFCTSVRRDGAYLYKLTGE
jgi:hypothetical protein